MAAIAEHMTFKDFPFLQELGLSEDNIGCYHNGKWQANGDYYTCINAHNNKPIARVKQATAQDYEECINSMNRGKNQWMMMPIPKRGEIVQQIGNALRQKKKALGALIALEMGKILQEGEGEVQEFIDMTDFACGLSRQLIGTIIPSERPHHIIMEQWNPLGLIGVVTAFNFPCAVFGWNLCLAMICGDSTIWKGASSTNLVTIACTKLVAQVLEHCGAPEGVVTMVTGGGRSIGNRLVEDHRLQLISFTGRGVSEVVHKRFGRTILELGGNNAVIVNHDANLELCIKGSIFSAVGTCGQRCTSLRRMIIHEKVYKEVAEKLLKSYQTINIGNPLEQGTLVGPLHNQAAVKEYEDGIAEIKKQGGIILYGGKRLPEKGPNYVLPTLVEISSSAPILKQELFVPIMYLIKFKTLEEAIQINNSVPQGLSSSLFTNDLKNLYKWIGPLGSDCGIVNVNIGPSGAEIGGAFGGEKETGGGREAGSDSWKQYMRRSTCTVNHGETLPLAQGIKFDI